MELRVFCCCLHGGGSPGLWTVHTVVFTRVAVALSLPMAAVGIRCIAETNYNPGSSLGMSCPTLHILQTYRWPVSQLAFAALISRSNPNALIIDLISAAMAQAGAEQSGDIACDSKVGSLVGARSETQVYGQVIDSLFGALISCSIYKLYASHYTIPGPLFRIPSSYLVLSTARLGLGQGLPPGVLPFALASAVLSALATVVNMRYADRWWDCLIPSGVSFAIGAFSIYHNNRQTLMALQVSTSRHPSRSCERLGACSTGCMFGTTQAGERVYHSTCKWTRTGGVHCQPFGTRSPVTRLASIWSNGHSTAGRLVSTQSLSACHL